MTPSEDKQEPAKRGFITEERIVEAQRVWSVVYKRPVTPEEAGEILLNVHRLSQALKTQILQEQKQ